MKGRIVPPSKLTIGELANYIIENPRVWVVEYAHDAGCPAQHTQRGDDCQCAPDVTLKSADGQLAIPVEGGAL